MCAYTTIAHELEYTNIMQIWALVQTSWMTRWAMGATKVPYLSLAKENAQMPSWMWWRGTPFGYVNEVRSRCFYSFF